MIVLVQLLSSVFIIRTLGAIEYGEIIALIAAAELTLTLSLSGIQKLYLKNILGGLSSSKLIRLKLVLLMSLIVLVYFIYGPDIMFIVFILSALDNVNALLRTPLHASKKYYSIVFLDVVRPSFLLIGVMYCQIGKTSFTFETFLSLWAAATFFETFFCLMRVWPSSTSNRKKENIPVKITELVAASSFNITNNVVRRVPILMASGLSPELGTLVAIYNQILTLINHIISACMTQLSILILDNHAEKNHNSDNISIPYKLLFLITILAFLGFDLLSFWILSFVFNFEPVDKIPLVTFCFFPILTLYAQEYFYIALSRDLSWHVFHKVFILIILLFLTALGLSYQPEFFGLNSGTALAILIFLTSFLSMAHITAHRLRAKK